MERRSPRPWRARAAHAGRRRLPYEFLAQNGAQLHQNTKITVTGCPKAKKEAQGAEAPEGLEEEETLSSGTRLTCAAMLFAGALLTPASSLAATAHVARSVYLSESSHLHLTSHHGFTLNEQGTASGTIRGPLYIHLNVVSTNHVSAEVSVYPSGSSLTGYAHAGYHVEGGTASFSGSMSINRGTGSYSHAHGSGLSFYGTIQRSNDAVSVHLRGRMYY